MTGFTAPCAALRPAPHNGGRRAIAVALVLLLHLAVLLILLRSTLQPPGPVRGAREMILLPAPMRNVAPARIEKQPEKAFAPAMPPAPFPSTAPSAPDVPAAPDLQGFGKSLFGCAPEKLNALSPEDRTRCGTAFAPPDAKAVAEAQSHVKDRARREAELAARNTPARLPCTSIQTVNIPAGGTSIYNFMVDPLCVSKGFENGFHNGPPP